MHDGLCPFDAAIAVDLRASANDPDHIVPAEMRGEGVEPIGEYIYLARVEIGIGAVGDHEGEEGEVGEDVFVESGGVGHVRAW